MIGLMFFGAIGLWGLISIFLGFKIPKWMGIKKYRGVWVMLFIPLVFFAPVADEIIAYPQWNKYCNGEYVTGFKYAPGMDDKNLYGRKIKYFEKEMELDIFPFTVNVRKMTVGYIDANTNEMLIYQQGVSVKNGMLHFPAGGSGSLMPLLWNKCSTNYNKFTNGYTGNMPNILLNLNITYSE